MNLKDRVDKVICERKEVADEIWKLKAKRSKISKKLLKLLEEKYGETMGFLEFNSIKIEQDWPKWKQKINVPY